MSTVAISARFPPEDLAEIDRRAKARGLSRTAFLLEAALADRLAQTADEARLEHIENRIDLIEEATFLRLEAATFD